MVNVSLVTAYNENGELLLGKRADNGKYTLAGGHLNPGETPREAAVRELTEESGLRPISMSYLTEWTTSEGVNLWCFSAFVQGTPHGNLDPDQEVTKWSFVDISNGLPSKIYNNLHGPESVDDNLVKRLFALRKAEDLETDLIKAEINHDPLAIHPKAPERTMAIRLNPNPDNLFIGSLDHDPTVWQLCLTHPGFTKDLASKLAGAPANAKGQFPSAQFNHLLESPLVDETVLNNLYGNLENIRPNDYTDLVNKLGSRSDIRSELWSKLYNNPDLSHQNRLNLLLNPEAHTDVLNNTVNEGIKSNDLEAIELGKKAIEHGNITQDEVEKLVRSAIGSNSEALLAIAAHALAKRQISDTLITDLLKQARSRPEHNHARLRLAALSGPGASGEHLDRGMEDPSTYVRNGLIFAPNASPKHIDGVIDRAIKDKDKEGIKSLLNHPKISGKHLNMLIKTETGNKPDHKIANLMLGDDLGQETLKAAKLLTGNEVDEANYRIYLIEADGDCEKAALKTYGVEPSEANIKALRAIMNIAGLNKSETVVPQPKEIANVYPEGLEMAEALKRAFKDEFVFNVMLAGKHSKGAMIARDDLGGKSYLLKPGSGSVSPAAGVNEEKASQSVREAAFYYVANVVGIGNWYPESNLILIDNKEYAVTPLLPWDYETLDHRRKEHPGIVHDVLTPLINNGVALQWAVLSYILGSVDEHANNILVGSNGEVKLIDHGSAFAGMSFCPGIDPNTFIPVYLRVNSNDFNSLSTKDKLQVMPKVSAQINGEISSWLNRIDPSILSKCLERFGIDSKPEVLRLIKLKESAAVMGVDVAVNRAWLSL